MPCGRSEEEKTMTENTSYVIPIYRLQLVKESEAEARPITSPLELAGQVRDLAQADREQMVCIHLDAKNRPISRQTVSIGTLDQAILTGRELYKSAILANAHRITLAHNHPSNDPTPSIEDDRITIQIAQAGRLLGIPLLDHVIVGPGGSFFSYSEQKPQLLKGGDHK